MTESNANIFPKRFANSISSTNFRYSCTYYRQFSEPIFDKQKIQTHSRTRLPVHVGNICAAKLRYEKVGISSKVYWPHCDGSFVGARFYQAGLCYDFLSTIGTTLADGDDRKFLIYFIFCVPFYANFRRVENRLLPKIGTSTLNDPFLHTNQV